MSVECSSVRVLITNEAAPTSSPSSCRPFRLITIDIPLFLPKEREFVVCRWISDVMTQEFIERGSGKPGATPYPSSENQRVSFEECKKANDGK
jgi:hypothetical protein